MQHDLLQPRLPEDPDRAFEVDHVIRVRQCFVVPVHHRAAYEEVQQERQRHQADLEHRTIDAMRSQQRNGAPRHAIISRRVRLSASNLSHTHALSLSPESHRATQTTTRDELQTVSCQPRTPNNNTDVMRESLLTENTHNISPPVRLAAMLWKGEKFSATSRHKSLDHLPAPTYHPVVPRGSGRPHTDCTVTRCIRTAAREGNEPRRVQYTAETVTSGSSGP